MMNWTNQPKANDLINQADAARDSRDWGLAAKLYQSALKLDASRGDIWVQFGHALKESGRLGPAVDAYRKAVELTTESSDAQLQLGHALKLSGDTAGARDAYEKALALDAGNAFAMLELSRLDQRGTSNGRYWQLDVQREILAAALIIDISDLVAFLRVHDRVTGIQRVQSCIVIELSATGPKKEDTKRPIHFVICDQSSQTIYELPLKNLRSLLTDMLDDNCERSSLNEHLEILDVLKRKFPVQSGDTYLILGAFWIGEDYSSTLVQLKKAGVTVGVYIYDLIPFTHPQFVTESTREDVIEKFANIMLLSDFALTISAYVAQEVDQLTQKELGRKIPIAPVLLAHTLPSPAARRRASGRPGIYFPEEFVLCVGTLEGRKNHNLLFDVWQSLYRRMGEALPPLILVGKWGWRIDEFRNRLENSDYLNGKIIVAGNVSDTELMELYEKCLFTVFPSFVEGWGLPVGEGLARGRPCIASNSSSIPEVGGDFVKYIDPHNPLKAAEVIQHALEDRNWLEAWAKKIKRDFKPRSWSEVASDLVKQTEACLEAAGSNDTKVVVLPPSRRHHINRLALFSTNGASWQARALKFVLFSGWHPIEDWGVWSRQASATLAFGTPLPPGAEARVIMNVQLAPQTTSGTITVSQGMRELVRAAFRSINPGWIEFVCKVGPQGEIELKIQRHGPMVQLDECRPLFVGLRSIAYHELNDLHGRISLLEELMFGSCWPSTQLT